MPKGYFTPFTKEQEEQIKTEYLDKPVKRLADELGTTYGRIMRFLKRNDLSIPREVVEKRKLLGRKRPGDIPFNKGLKQSEYMTPAGIERTKNTRFKKGSIPSCTLEIGSERELRGYIKVKIGNPNKWEFKQRLIYEKHHNEKLAEDEIVIFKDGNNRNFKPENLEKITRVESMYRNSHQNYPKEIIPTLVLTNQIKKFIQNAK